MARGRRGGKRLDTYQICVTIIEAKHLEENTNPMVVVRVGNRKKKTAVRRRTDNPYYNEYFVFDLTCSMDALLSTRIELAVYLCGRLKRSKLHGNIVFEVAVVWDQPDHQYHHKWALLTHPRDQSAGPRGFVKCNIAVHAKGQKFKMPPETEGDEDIEGNLLLPLGDPRYLAARQRARYLFTVHRAEDLAGRACHVVVSFAGMKASTSWSRVAGNPRFDERLAFKEMFPPLCHRARITLKCRKSGSSCCRSDALASYLLNLRSISNSGEYGFLPTFGPSFLHLYAEDGDLVGPIYRGRLLLSLKTELEHVEAGPTSGVHVEPVASIVEQSLWRIDEYLLVGVFYDVCMIDRGLLSRGKTVSFEISLGNAGNRRFSGHQRVCDDEDSDDDDDTVEPEPTGCASADSESTSIPQKVDSLDGRTNCAMLGTRKPCVFLKSRWPNTEWRVRNANRLRCIAAALERDLERLEGLRASEQDSAYVAYNGASRCLGRHCAAYLEGLEDMVRDAGHLGTLDRHRFNLCRREVQEVLRRVRLNGELADNRLLGIAMLHAYRHLSVIRRLHDDPQHSLPDVFIWMLSGSRRLAFARIPSHVLTYAEDRPERGVDCGQRQMMFLARPGRSHEAVCKAEVFLWLGNAKFAAACWGALPPGYVLEEQFANAPLDAFPRFLEFDQSSKYQLRVHIFQGRFEPGMDSSGLLDPMVRVIFQSYTMSTRVIKQTLDPFWDQTLVFPPADVHGIREYVKNHPPKVVLEAFDRDYCNSLELYGRCIVAPTVKLNTETYSPPDFPPKLRWHKFTGGRADFTGAVLAALELIEVGDKETVDLPLDPSEMSPRELRVPEDIRPRMASHRLEVIFWGVRDMRRVNLIQVTRPKVVVECGGSRVESQVMDNARKFANFREIHASIDIEMAEDEVYYPPITITAYDSRGFGYFKYVGVCNIPTIYVFMQRLITKSEYEEAIYHSPKKSWPAAHFAVPMEPKVQQPLADVYAEEEEATALTSYKRLARRDAPPGFFSRLLGWRRHGRGPSCAAALDRDESHDWWSKYYASLEEDKIKDLVRTSQRWKKQVATFKVYAAELEAQREFSGFQDRLRSFELRRGKKVGDPSHDENNCVGTFKGFIAAYRWPHPEGLACVTRAGKSASLGLLDDYPSQETLPLLVRVYVVKAINLSPRDPLSGKSDPYLRVKLGKNHIGDRKNYIPNQLNPTFGRVFELEATFPRDHALTIQVWDYDSTSADDFIGETRVDIENRFYSRHRGHCGLALAYDAGGYNAWRDRERPCQILGQLCRRNGLPPPEYWDDRVLIGERKFRCELADEGDDAEREERLALSVLHRWADFPICGCALVPEHIERRPLFNPKRPGLEQGSLEMWIDMFPIDELPARPAIDISPQAPEDYELRVTVWNTEDVPLVDNQFLTGEKCSDVYVKGWILPEDTQRTDVHYNSLTGEGNFNWRFVFRFTWARGERMMIVRRKTSVFAKDETEQKMPCKLNIQVWDSDHFSKDDFLGSLSLDLANMPKGSSNPRNCTLRLLEPFAPRESLFRVQRTRAWWPLATSNAVGKFGPAGKVEMELSVLPASEADQRPVGRGREPPEALPPPDRPDTSFSWFRNPWKACCFVVCRYYRWRILGCCCCLLLVLLVACGIYAFPGYLVKRMLGA